MGHDALMDPLGSRLHLLLYQICIVTIGTSGTVKVTVPTQLILGTVGQSLLLPANYTTDSGDHQVQITWTFQSQSSGSMLLVTATNNVLTHDMEHGHRFFLSPTSASLWINPVELRDEGEYTVKVTVSGVKVASASRQLTVHVNVPVSKPVVWSEPVWGAVENVDNATLNCSVDNGTKIVYQWLKAGKPIRPSSRHTFSSDNKTLFISPVLKEDLSNYSCVARNPISANESEPVTPNIYYGPYDLTVNSEAQYKIREGVFAIGKGMPILFKCSASSNPPNVYSWFQKSNNETRPIQWGPLLRINSGKAPEKADYTCCVYNNITGKRDEAQVTLILSVAGQEAKKHTRSSLHSLTIIVAISLALIVCVLFYFCFRRCYPRKVIRQELYHRSPIEYIRAHEMSVAHESSMDDYGIYEFVAVPEPAQVQQARPDKLSTVYDFIRAPDLHTTIYEVICHSPETF
ncbi:HEPACAM family member 2 [Callorhinchus milii]|uniref:Ig-like domain-containing protein n=1 Tax=Callorhinchus milii TaxID=7868 RepID=A0A4W3JXN4_CALMI|nr:HEPACAM family member 2 [Callorhinchus milii]XP_007903507.1 HEPACAM family member 2 [Callorhinchus milii]|eukprot:gi/632974139/ref/XP_007903506.1/ PREDICTED: HEPACAM family member 2 [Callorhinchus milii]